MKSGLEDRNNPAAVALANERLLFGLNEVRPGRPEQFGTRWSRRSRHLCLNEVRPGRPEQSTVGRQGHEPRRGLVDQRRGGDEHVVDLPPTTPPSKPEEPQTPGKPKKKNILPSTGTVENFFLCLMGLDTTHFLKHMRQTRSCAQGRRT